MMRMIATLIAYAVISFLSVNVHAQSYPKQPINLLIPLAPGDATDVAGRTIGEGLSKLLKVPVVAINKEIAFHHKVPEKEFIKKLYDASRES